MFHDGTQWGGETTPEPPITCWKVFFFNNLYDKISATFSVWMLNVKLQPAALSLACRQEIGRKRLPGNNLMFSC